MRVVDKKLGAAWTSLLIYNTIHIPSRYSAKNLATLLYVDGLALKGVSLV